MADYVKVEKFDDSIHVWFYNENDKVFAIGEKMNEINECAYMNGYNWDALFNYYLEENAPEVLDGLESAPEAGSYAAVYYEATPENEIKARKFADIIVDFIENEEKLYSIVREHGDEIEWD